MNSIEKAWMVFVAMMIVAGLWTVRARAQSKPQWTYESCLTNTCVADALNRLSPERASEAKLTTWSAASGITYVWYRK